MINTRWIDFNTADEMATAACDRIIEILRARSDAHLCLPTGTTPLPVYRDLVKRLQNNEADSSRLRVTKLDEWLGIPMDHPASCESYLRTHLLEPLNVTSDRYIGFNSAALDMVAECESVSNLLAGGGPFDLVIVGVGVNGHIGMNEPASALFPNAHVTVLADTTRHHHMLQGVQEPPTHGVTLGMGEILNTREIMVLLGGQGKAGPWQFLREGLVSTDVPVSFVHLHPNAAVFSSPF